MTKKIWDLVIGNWNFKRGFPGEYVLANSKSVEG
jgi:hypothetical protein